MFKIAIIGVGQLGSRHLQGIASISEPTRIYLIDPQGSSLEIALARFKEISVGPEIHRVVTGHSITDLPSELDLAIVATSADIRLSVLEALLQHCRVGSLVLEKVLFQQERDYEHVIKLVSATSTKAWVNCPRRSYEYYQSLKEALNTTKIRRIDITGGAWGLGCNAVHFADLFQYLTGEVVEFFDGTKLDPVLYPSKRPGCVEFGGMLIGRSKGGATLTLSSEVTSAMRLIIGIRADDGTHFIDEGRRIAWGMSESLTWQEAHMIVPFQSQLTGKLVEDILHRGDCSLPRLPLSSRIHLPLVACLLKHYREISGEDVVACPIT